MDGFFQESFFEREFLISEEGGNPGKKTVSVGELDENPRHDESQRTQYLRCRFRLERNDIHEFSPVNCGKTSGRLLAPTSSKQELFFPLKVSKLGNAATRFSSFFLSHIPFSEVEAGIFGSGFRSCGLFGVDLLAVGSEKETSLATLHLGLTTGRWFEDFHGSKAWVQKSCYKVILEMFTLFCLPGWEEGLPI